MWIRAGASNRSMASALGVDVELVFSLVFAAGAALARACRAHGRADHAVQVGMGEPVLILALVVTVIGGIGSIKRRLRRGPPDRPRPIPSAACCLPPALGSMIIFMMMAAILAWRPRGLFPVHG